MAGKKRRKKAAPRAANDNAAPKKRKRKKAKKTDVVFRPLDELGRRRYDNELKKLGLADIINIDLSNPNVIAALEAKGWEIRQLDSDGRPSKPKKKAKRRSPSTHKNQRRRFARRKKKNSSARAQTDARIVGQLIELSKVRSKKKT